MRYSAFFRRLALGWPLLLLSLLATAQTPQPPASPTLPDVIVRVNGDELPARVLVISGTALRYFGVPDSAHAATDTLTLARAEVFMVRFANGTKEVMAPPATAAADPAAAPEPADLAALTLEQRYEKGRHDAQNYKPAPGVFWGTFGATVGGGMLGGVGAGAAIGLTPPKREHLVTQAPQPQLLADPSYYQGFEKQAQHRKLGKAAAGFGVGVGVQTLLTLTLLTLLFSSWTLY